MNLLLYLSVYCVVMCESSDIEANKHIKPDAIFDSKWFVLIFLFRNIRFFFYIC